MKDATFPPRRFVRVGRNLREVVYAAMHIGILRCVIMRERVDDRVWFLRGGAVVEVRERLAPHSFAQNGKICANAAHIKRLCRTRDSLGRLKR